MDEFLNAGCGYGVKRRTWFIHQDYFRIHGDSAGNAQTLLLAA
jgi:hypothetical protein